MGRHQPSGQVLCRAPAPGGNLPRLWRSPVVWAEVRRTEAHRGQFAPAGPAGQRGTAPPGVEPGGRVWDLPIVGIWPPGVQAPAVVVACLGDGGGDL